MNIFFQYPQVKPYGLLFVLFCFVFSKNIMAEIDKHLLALAYGTVVSSGEFQNSRRDARNTTQLDSCTINKAMF